MWLSQRAGRVRYMDKSTDIGDVTIADTQTGVVLDGEQRSLGLTFPGGYAWRPRKGQNVVVLKSAGGESLVAGVPEDAAPSDLAPGEVLIRADSGSSVKLGSDGLILHADRIDIVGELYINGEIYKPCTCS